MQTKVDPSSFCLVCLTKTTRLNKDIFSQSNWRQTVQAVTLASHARFENAVLDAESPVDSEQAAVQVWRGNFSPSRHNSTCRAQARNSMDVATRRIVAERARDWESAAHFRKIDPAAIAW